ncbi:hypothetical protein Sm713_53320 [Streptomyces sp. TS71-3]|nr:hypothetical protein Sm713_53320 [Streptomyces sp. TS71-3]
MAALVRTAAPRGLSWAARVAQTTHRVRPPRPSGRERQAERPRSGAGPLPHPGRRPAAQEGGGPNRPGTAGWRRVRALHAMPRQVVPPTETVDLTPAERAAFAGLVRQFSEGRR